MKKMTLVTIIKATNPWIDMYMNLHKNIILLKLFLKPFKAEIKSEKYDLKIHTLRIDVNILLG